VRAPLGSARGPPHTSIPARSGRADRAVRWANVSGVPTSVTTNVLAGAMSLVGPRPLRAVLVERYLEDLPEFAERHTDEYQREPNAALVIWSHKPSK
jgi:hypothetical protein